MTVTICDCCGHTITDGQQVCKISLFVSLPHKDNCFDNVRETCYDCAKKARNKFPEFMRSLV